MAEDLRLRVIMEMGERMLAPLKRITSSSTAAAAALKAAKDRLKELNAQQQAVGDFRAARTGLEATNTRLQAAQTRLAALAKAHGQATTVTRAMAREMAGAKREASGLAEQQDRQRLRVQQLRDKLSAAGISTRDLSTHERRLRGDVATTTTAIDQQTERLRANADQQRKLANLRQAHAKSMLHVGMLAGAGAAMQAAGRKGVDMAMGPVRSFSQHEDAMLGIARQVPGARDEMGKLTPVYRAIEEQARRLSGQIPQTTTAIIDMMTAAARMEVPTDQIAEFTLLASEMATAFDAVPDELAESMGKVAKNFKIPLTEIRGLADSINYLDDNAISKGRDIIDYLNRTSGVVSTLAMSARDAAALGSTMLTLGERAETAGTATNAILSKFAAATKGTKKFHAALGELGLSTEAVQKGMSRDATSTLLQVIEAIRKLPEDGRIGVMVELVGMEHADTLAKLVDKPEELRRQLDLAGGKDAAGSMAREAAARNAALSAQWQMAKNRAFNLAATVGESLAPALHELMSAVNPMLEGLSRWVRENATLVKWVGMLALGLSGLLVVLGAVLMPLALLYGKFMLLRFLFARLQLGLLGVRAAAGAVAPAMGLLYRLGYAAGRGLAFMLPVLSAVGRGVLLLGRFLLATPLGLALTLLGTAAVLVYRHWEGIKGGALALWQDLVALKDRFFSAGADLLNGLVNGISSRAAALRDTVVATATAVAQWFKEKLGINSPSRVFMQYGAWISEGAALGMQRGQHLVQGAALAVAATTDAPMMATASPTSPLRAAPSAMGATAGASHQITINAAPGMDAQAIARAVSAELDRRDRARRSRALSQLSDTE